MTLAALRASFLLQLKNKQLEMLAPFLREQGYTRLFFSSITNAPFTDEQFGIPQSFNGENFSARLFVYTNSYGSWVAFKNDEDAIHFKLMEQDDFKLIERWELYDQLGHDMANPPVGTI